MITVHLMTAALIGWLAAPQYRVDFTPAAITCDAKQSLPAVATVLRNGSAYNARANFFAKNTAVATIARTGDRTATVRCQAKGTTYVGAGYKGKRDSAKTVVRGCALATFIVVPGEADLVDVGDTLTATASLLNDCSQMDTTTVMTWVSRAPGIAGVTSTGMRKARITAVAQGYTYVVGLVSTFKDSVAVCVDSALTVTVAPVSLVLDPVQTGAVVADVNQCGAAVAGAVTWATRSGAVATVASTGLQTATVTGVAAGNTYIVGTRLGASDSTAVTVNAPAGPCTPTATHMCPGDNVATKVSAQAAGTSFTFGAGLFRLTSTITAKANMQFRGAGPTTILTGSTLLTTWTSDGAGHWYATSTSEIAPSGSGFCDATHPRCDRAEDLYRNDTLLTHVADLATVSTNSYFFDYPADRVYVGSNPAGKTMELSTVSRAFQGAVAGVKIAQLKVQKYASLYNNGAIFAMNATGRWFIDTVYGRWNHSSALAMSSASSGVSVHGGVYNANGQYGITSNAGTNDTIIGAVMDSNATVGFEHTWGTGGIKVAFSTGFVFRRNFVRYNKGHGIWFDIDNYQTVIDSNETHYNYKRGIFYEISYQGIIRGNVATNNGKNAMCASVLGKCSGIGIVSSSDVTVIGNTVSDNRDGITAVQDERGSGDQGHYEMRDLVVDANTINTSVAMAAGLVNNTGDGTYYTTKNNLWSNNNYTGSVSATPYYWLGAARTQAQWTGYGQD